MIIKLHAGKRILGKNRWLAAVVDIPCGRYAVEQFQCVATSLRQCRRGYKAVAEAVVGTRYLIYCISGLFNHTAARLRLVAARLLVFAVGYQCSTTSALVFQLQAYTLTVNRCDRDLHINSPAARRILAVENIEERLVGIAVEFHSRR